MLLHSVWLKGKVVKEDTWVRIDRSGFFPREGESEASFLLDHNELFHSFSQRAETSCSWLTSATKRFFHFFHTVPCWIKPVLQAKGLAPWEMAACWQYSTGESVLQANPKILKMKEQERESILFHELIHASRSRLQALCFEEILAYEAMKQEKESLLFSIRRILSRLFLLPTDALFTIVWHMVLLILSLLDVFSLSTYVGLILFFWGSLTIRACWLLRTWKKAFSNLEKGFPGKGWAFFLRASDSDILWIATLPPQEENDSIMEKASYDWRWKYFVVCTLS